MKQGGEKQGKAAFFLFEIESLEQSRALSLLCSQRLGTPVEEGLALNWQQKESFIFFLFLLFSPFSFVFFSLILFLAEHCPPPFLLKPTPKLLAFRLHLSSLPFPTSPSSCQKHKKWELGGNSSKVVIVGDLVA